MRKLAEKVVIVAQICITLVFAITALLNTTNIIYNREYGNGYASTEHVVIDNCVLK